MAESRQKILIVRLAALGDIANTTALLSRIRSECPGAHITWVVGRGGAGLVRMFDGVDRIIEVDERRLLTGNVAGRILELARLWASLVGSGGDLAIIAHADRRYRWLVPMIPRSRVRMFTNAVGGRTNPIPGRFVGDEAARLLAPAAEPAGAFSWPLADVRTAAARVSVPAEWDVGSIDVVLVPGGARNVLRDSPLRRWPAESYAQVARALIADGNRVAIIGDASDSWARTAFEGLPVVDLIGRSSIEQTLRVLSEARLVITHDTGPLHFARLVRAPTIALFGPTAPRQMVGHPPEVTILWGGEHLACRPCYDGREFAPCRRNLCMEDIAVPAVLDAARARLNAAAPAPARAT